MAELVAQWYSVLNTVNRLLAEPVRAFAEGAGVPLIPLALASPGGALFPVLFALGTAVPVLAILGALALGIGGARATGLVGRVQPFFTQLAGAVLLLTGINDTVVYWFL